MQMEQKRGGAVVAIELFGLSRGLSKNDTCKVVTHFGAGLLFLSPRPSVESSRVVFPFS